MSWVTIASFENGLNAHVLRGKLQSEGIDAEIADEEIVRMNWLWSQAVGGVKVRVREEDVSKAGEVMRAIEVSKPQSKKDDLLPECLQCGSRDVFYERRPYAVTVLFFFLLALPLPLFMRRWNCRDCHHHWRAK